ncbi:MAG: M14 family zinc carboxypeptidase [Candidatus Vogelbacteria bacterium]|nr:M14 family zinc carboxypeptidase [Candidatus Vogelbacteria bacterium]
MKNTIIGIVVIVVIIIGVYYFTKGLGSVAPVTSDQATTTDVTSSTTDQTGATPNNIGETVIGTSVEKNDITAYHYGTGEDELLFVGGIHGGYEWNTTLVAYELMDYLKANPDSIPKNIKVTVIPVLNPDGLKKVVGTIGRFTPADVSTSKETVIAGRLNANKVDVNRNFDCDWQASAVWQKTKVSGGSQAFSEPESLAFKNYIESHSPKVVVVWYSAAGGVFASACDNGILPETLTLAKTYANASGYKAYDSFDFYETTGDMVNWLAKKSIPAISVVLSTHDDTEWSKNQAGIEALLKAYTK